MKASDHLRGSSILCLGNAALLLILDASTQWERGSHTFEVILFITLGSAIEIIRKELLELRKSISKDENAAKPEKAIPAGDVAN